MSSWKTSVWAVVWDSLTHRQLRQLARVGLNRLQDPQQKCPTLRNERHDESCVKISYVSCSLLANVFWTFKSAMEILAGMERHIGWKRSTPMSGRNISKLRGEQESMGGFSFCCWRCLGRELRVLFSVNATQWKMEPLPNEGKCITVDVASSMLMLGYTFKIGSTTTTMGRHHLETVGQKNVRTCAHMKHSIRGHFG